MFRSIGPMELILILGIVLLLFGVGRVGKDMVEFLAGLLNTPSPTGYHERAIEYCESAFEGFPLSLARSKKGALIGTWDGRSDSIPRGLTAHIDTLGGMVAKIKGNGRL